jgi:hypothetical protein
MKNHSVVLSLLFISFCFSLQASQNQIKSNASQFLSFKKQWKQVDSLSSLGQPKSALEIVEKIYNQSKKEKNDPQFIKAVIYQLKLQADFREEALASTIRDLKKEIKSADEPVRQILNSVLAEVYWKYYQNNRYRFTNRSQVWNNQSDSIQTWDLNTLTQAIIKTYRQSLENKALLRNVPIKTFEVILEVPDKHAVTERDFRPTLYDFLVWRALDYFMSNSGPKQISGEEFKIDREEYFLQAKQFSGMKIKTPVDSLSLDYFGVLLFQDLATFHLTDKDPRALVDEELNRLDYFHDKTTVERKDSIYLEALKVLETQYLSSPYSTDVSFAIAQFLNEQGTQYNPLESENHKWDVKSAKDFCDHAIQRFPESNGAKNCRILLARIKQPSLSITAEYAVIPGKASLGLIAFQNIPVVHFRVIKVDPEVSQEKTSGMTREEQIRYYTNLPVFKTWLANLPLDGDFQIHKIEVKIPELPVGYYTILCSSDVAFKDTLQAIAWSGLFSTQISYISQRNDISGVDFYFLDRETGNPLKNISVEVFQKIYNYHLRKYESKKTGDFLSDAQGFLSIPALSQGGNASNYYLKLHQKLDLFISENFFQYNPFDRAEKPFLSTSFFTDRAIYRPGQTIYFKGILLEKTGDKSVLKPGVQTTVTFNDVNFQKIASQNFTTNEFGSFNGSFIAPQGVLLGQMTISNGSGSSMIRVEEYKRPTFEVTFNPLEGNYRLNDSILVTGKATAYAGNNIDGAHVTYRVIRTSRFPYRECWWCPFPVSPEVEIANGTLTTKGDGSFSFRFKAVQDKSIEKTLKPVFDYTLYADVTDINGETQSANDVVSVGSISLLIGIEVPKQINVTKDSVFKLTATNLNGRKTPATITILLQRLHEPDSPFKTRRWERPDLMGFTKDEFHSLFPNDIFGDEDNSAKWAIEETVVQTEMNSLTDSLFRLIAKDGRPINQWLKPGSYMMTLKANDPYGETIQNSIPLTVFNPSSKETPVNVLNWFTLLNVTGEPGEKARFLIGSKETDVNVIYEVRIKDSLCSRETLKVSNNQLLVEVPILEKYRGNFSVNFVFVKHNRAFQNSQTIVVPYTNKKLDIFFSTFRSKLSPGQDEEWKINITNASKKGVEAEFQTTMYDASLDVFVPNAWSFSIFRSYFAKPEWDTHGSFTIKAGSYYPTHTVTRNYMLHEYDQLNWFGFSYFGNSRTIRGLKMGMHDKMVLEEKATPVANGKGDYSPEVMYDVVEQSATGESVGEKGINPASPIETRTTQPGGILIRRDFRETAFFYPSLLTDSTGSLVIKFTVPESLTKWKVLGFAHTKDLSFGQTEKEVITQKEIMVFPNAPRFVRQGDTVVFSAKVANLSDRALSGDIQLEILDPITSKPLNIVADESKDPSGAMRTFTLPLGQSVSHQWKLIIPVDPACEILQYRVIARAGNFSDGEEKAIPVLTNRMLVTESLPLPVNGKGTFDFHFDKLIQSQPGKTLKNYKLTLEFASNPAWYAVQALPTLDDPKFPNADNIFDAFYANSIASCIANSNPKIKQVFDLWRTQAPDALLSNLEKNESLKSALLQETPWIMEAKNETQRKQRIAMLFDLNTLTNRLDQNLKKLQKMQKENGAWPWFEGMDESRYITQNIVTGLGRLGHLGAKNIREDKETWSMVMKAVKYLDGALVKDYEYIRKQYPDKMEENHLGSTEIQYLYARSYFINDLPVNSAYEIKLGPDAFEYYRKQAEKYWLQNDIYLQGMIGLALNRLGNKEVPKLIIKSFTEKALHSPEMGMYWAVNSGYEWYQAPVETQALMIEAFDEITFDQKSVDEMKIWLLKQKQTQDWKTGKATVEACYALLLRGTDLLAESPEVKITLGKNTIDPKQKLDTKTEAGTGYFQVTWDGKEIGTEMGKISISKSTEGIAWGALYWQYFEDLDKITPHQTPMKIEKKLFVEKNTPSGPVLKEIAYSLNGKSLKEDLQSLKTGDKLKVRIILSVDRNLEYVHMKDMRASAFEPVISSSSRESNGALSGYRYQGGLGYYQSTTDAATNFFFDYLPKGTWVFEYPLVANAAGDYSNGITTIECMYAPEFAAHSEGVRVTIK